MHVPVGIQIQIPVGASLNTRPQWSDLSHVLDSVFLIFVELFFSITFTSTNCNSSYYARMEYRCTNKLVSNELSEIYAFSRWIEKQQDHELVSSSRPFWLRHFLSITHRKCRDGTFNLGPGLLLTVSFPFPLSNTERNRRSLKAKIKINKTNLT